MTSNNLYISHKKMKVNDFQWRMEEKMPTNKNSMQYILDDEYFQKFKVIQGKMKRKSSSDLSRYIVEKFIEDYEEIHGEIKSE